jgi:hypothetical protein
MKRIIVIACGLLASCGQQSKPYEPPPLPGQAVIANLCYVFRLDIYTIAKTAANTKSDQEFANNLKMAEDEAKFLKILNCRQWTPS